MRFAAGLLLLTWTAGSIGQVIDPVPRSLGDVSLSNPAFLEIYETRPDAVDHADKYTLFISTFNPVTIFLVLNLI
jgi:hypothetical protein